MDETFLTFADVQEHGGTVPLKLAIRSEISRPSDTGPRDNPSHELS